MKQLICLLLVILSGMPPAVLAAVDASVDRQQVYDGDTLTLTIETDAGVQGAPDLSPLKHNFEVLDSSNFSSFSFVNGRQSSHAGWRIRLRPLRTGALRIPSLDVGGKKTNPITVQVSPVPPDVAKRNADRLFVETEVDTGGHPPYLQQQVRLIVRLFYRVRVLDSKLSEPQPDGDVVFERMGKDRRYEAMRNGKRYQVLEREYAMFPLRSGELHIPSVVFNGWIAEPQQRRSQPRSPTGGLFDRFFNDPFDDEFFRDSPFGQKGRSITARSPGKTLKVLPRPGAYKGQAWLPAADVQLSDSWTENPPQLGVGEPVTRVLTLTAKGVEGSQLPPLDIQPGTDYNVYPEQPSTRSRVQGGWVLGEQRRVFAIVPTRPGRLVLPAIRIHWWNTGENRERETVLPRWELQVAPGTGQSAPPASARTAPASGAGSVASLGDRTGGQPATAAGPQGLPGSYIPWLIAAVTLLLMLLVLLFARRRRRAGTARVRPAPEAPVSASVPEKPDREQRHEALRQLQTACAGGAPQAVAKALLGLARIEWPQDPPLDLVTLSRRCPQHAQALASLDRAIYAGAGAGDWSVLCEACWDGLDCMGQDGNTQGREDLAPLYPAGSRS